MRNAGAGDEPGPESSARTAPSIADLDIAVAHWGINAWGGAEYVATKLAESVGAERIYTTRPPAPTTENPYGDVQFVPITDSLSPRPLRKVQARVGRLFEYTLWEDVDWRDYGDPDVVLTSGATPRAVITPDDTLHLNYCHSPPRWLYDLYHDRKTSLTGQFLRPLIRYLRMRDQIIDPRVDGYLVNSPIISRRLQKYYKRESTVLYPPIELSKYHNDGDGGFYLHLGRLDTQKGISAVVDAFVGSDTELVIAGGRGDCGDELMPRIRSAPNIEYRGFVDDETKLALLASCRAVVFNGRNEDFGIVPIEANASGKPVLTRAEGFPGLFIQDGQNGLHHDGTSSGIRRAVERLERESIEDEATEFVEQFSQHRFESRLHTEIARAWDRFGISLE